MTYDMPTLLFSTSLFFFYLFFLNLFIITIYKHLSHVLLAVCDVDYTKNYLGRDKECFALRGYI